MKANLRKNIDRYETESVAVYKLLVSSVNDDRVVKEPQNPTAPSTEYHVTKLNASDATENAPNTNCLRG
jgi:hypothetical protein